MTNKLDLDGLLRAHNPDDRKARRKLAHHLAVHCLSFHSPIFALQQKAATPPDSSLQFPVYETFPWSRLAHLIRDHPDFSQVFTANFLGRLHSEAQCSFGLSRAGEPKIKGYLCINTTYASVKTSGE